MNIRTRLTIQFILVVSFIFLFCFTMIYMLLSHNRKVEYYARLQSKANTAVDLLLNSGQIDSADLRQFDKRQKDTLASRFINIFKVDGRLIYTNRDTVIFPIDAKLIKRILEKDIYFRFRHYEALGAHINGQTTKAIVITGAIDKQSIEKNAYLFRLFLLLCPLIIFIVAMAGRLLIKNALSPLSHLVAEIKSFPIHSLEARLTPVNYSDEIGLLTQTFNSLLERIQNAVNLQRIFLSAASHEMKNPLNSITSQLQVLYLKPRTTEEYREVIASVLNDLSELNKSTLNLIEYARLSYEIDTGITFQQIRVDDLIWHCAEYYARIHPDCKIRVKFLNPPENQSLLEIKGNEYLLKSCFLNLIDNGFKFSNRQPIEIILERIPDGVRVLFKDEGNGISQQDIPYIFEPFYRSNNAGSIKGHGLGLALVKRVMIIHHAIIEVESKNDKGSQFILTFPMNF